MRALALIGSPSRTPSSKIVIVAQSYIGEWSKFPVAVQAMIALAVVKITDKPSLEERLREDGVTITKPPEKSSEDNGYDITIETPVDNGNYLLLT